MNFQSDGIKLSIVPDDSSGTKHAAVVPSMHVAVVPSMYVSEPPPAPPPDNGPRPSNVAVHCAAVAPSDRRGLGGQRGTHRVSRVSQPNGLDYETETAVLGASTAATDFPAG